MREFLFEQIAKVYPKLHDFDAQRLWPNVTTTHYARRSDADDSSGKYVSITSDKALQSFLQHRESILSLDDGELILSIPAIQYLIVKSFDESFNEAYDEERAELVDMFLHRLNRAVGGNSPMKLVSGLSAPERALLSRFVSWLGYSCRGCLEWRKSVDKILARLSDERSGNNSSA